MTDARPLIHIGYHKTATTWMQDRLFRPEHGFRQILTHADVWRDIAGPHPLAFDPAPARARIAERRTGVTPGIVPVISSEILSGQPFEGGHEAPAYAERLARVAPEARILITIRDQFRIIPSVYMQYLSRGGTLPPARFLSGTRTPGYRGFEVEHFHYDRLVALYDRLFGAAAVLIVRQEDIRDDPAATAARIAGFAGAARFTGLEESAADPRAPSYPEYAVPVLRRLNHLRRGPMNPWPPLSLGTPPRDAYRLAGWLLRRPALARRLSHLHPVSDAVRAALEGRFADSNRALAALRPELPLTGYEGIEAAKAT